MAQPKKRYFIKSIIGGEDSIGKSLEKNLMRISSIGLNWDKSLIRNMKGLGVTETNDDAFQSYGLGNYAQQFEDKYNKIHSIVGENDFIAFYDRNYSNRRDFLRKFSMQGEIEYAVSTIADDAIVHDDNNYFAYPNTRQLFSHLKKERGKEIIDNLNNSYKKVYNAWKFNETNDAWHYFYKFLVDGIIAFEIIYQKDNKTGNAIDILGFQELEVTTLEPGIITDDNGNQVKVWYQYKGDKQNERILLDSNVIYISWSKSNFISRISYVEHLIRPFNMLRTLENSRIIWNLQNAQKQLKIVVPVGTQNEIKRRQRLADLKAEYKEDVTIDDLSGEVTVNGSPKFNFAKTFLFPSDDQGSIDISEIGVGGHDLSNIEQLKFFYQKFVLETKIPSSRFGNLFGNQGNTTGIPTSEDVQNREEYTYSLFIKRCRNLFKEILIKPTWNLFCIKYPEFNTNRILRSLIGLNFVEDNLFTLAKLRKIASEGASVVGELSSIQNPDGSPFFSMKFLTEKYLGLTPEDYKLNEKYLKADKVKYGNLSNSKGPEGDFGGGSDFGGSDFGRDSDFGEDTGDFDNGNDSELDAPDMGDDFGEPGSGFSDAEADLDNDME